MITSQGISSRPAVVKFSIVIDNGASVITTGVKGYQSFPMGGLIVRARLFADVAGAIVIDIWKDSYANFPPTVADTITAAAKPTLSATQKYEDTTLTGWVRQIAAGDVFGFNVDSASTVHRVIVELDVIPN